MTAADDDRSVERMMSRCGVIPVLTLDDAGSAGPLANALSTGGIGVAEVTLRTDAGLAAIRTMRTEVPELLVGAGTVCSVADAHAAIDAGAQFLVSPGFSSDIVTAGRAAGTFVLPGVATATELMTAREAGVRTVKVFPAEAIGGTRLLAAFSAVFPDVSFVPTGGVTLGNAAEYLGLPAVLAVGGSWLADRAAIERADWAEIAARSAAARTLVEDARCN